jgi:hypothetical protein
MLSLWQPETYSWQLLQIAWISWLVDWTPSQEKNRILPGQMEQEERLLLLKLHQIFRRFLFLKLLKEPRQSLIKVLHYLILLRMSRTMSGFLTLGPPTTWPLMLLTSRSLPCHNEPALLMLMELYPRLQGMAQSHYPLRCLYIIPCFSLLSHINCYLSYYWSKLCGTYLLYLLFRYSHQGDN